jgi:hypothetical protein
LFQKNLISFFSLFKVIQSENGKLVNENYKNPNENIKPAVHQLLDY